MKLSEISKELNTQDNRYTRDPIYIVEQLDVQYGLDPLWTEDTAWYSTEDFYEANNEESIKLYEQYDKDFDEPDGWVLTGKIERYVFVQPFFTEKSANEYIQLNSHNLNQPRVYVHTGYKNAEWKTVRELLMGGKING